MFYLWSCNPSQPDYLNPEIPIDQRVDDLVSRMTLEEKIAQMSHLAPAIERLDVVAYEPNFNNSLDPDPWWDEEEKQDLIEVRPWENYEHWEAGDCMDGGWWNEALHGVARSGLATAFPQSIALGSTWDPDLVRRTMSMASTEARVHHNVYGKKLTYWSPTINILRDPRWGRNEESYSEDPYLLSQMALAFVQGFQGDHPQYLKAISTVKHFVANNSEYNRHTGSADVSDRWLREYYFPAFRTTIEQGGAYSVMSAYNAVNGVPVSVSPHLLTDILRREWGFEGYVVSDCGAVSDIVHQHKFETDPEKAVAMAAKAGLDLECETCETEQFMFDKYLPGALEKGYLTEADIDINVKRLFRARMKLGEFDPPGSVPFDTISRAQLDSDAHRAAALEAARKSLVLLKNQNGFLPLDKDKLERVAVIGPNADILELGGYSGSPAVQVDPLNGLRTFLGDEVEITYARGCEISDRREVGWDEANDRPLFEAIEEDQTIEEAAALAAQADVAILFLGTNHDIANEAADRQDLQLPGNQLRLAQEVFRANPNTAVVLINGMPLSVNWLDENIPAILEAWYAGQAQGTAIAEALFGAYNPGGKLPVTFYRGVDDLPPLGDYDITKGRTYWFFEGEVLYPFGHGLSYTSFSYGDLELSAATLPENGDLQVQVEVSNTGPVRGDEVVQLYVRDVASTEIQPARKLRGFQRISLAPGESRTVSFSLDRKDFQYWDGSAGRWTVEAGDFVIQIGSSSADIRTSRSITVD